MLDKNFSTGHFEIFFLFFQENRTWYFMQIVSLGDNMHERKILFSRKNEKKFPQFVVC